MNVWLLSTCCVTEYAEAKRNKKEVDGMVKT